MSMFCFQCEQTARGEGCTTRGVCGKSPEVAALQDVIVHQLKGIGFLADALRAKGLATPAADRYVVDGLFTTVTNVDFDPARLETFIGQGASLRSELLAQLALDPATLPPAARFVPETGRTELVAQGARVGILSGPRDIDVRSLHALLLYGLKGAAAYTDHAQKLGQTDDAVYAYFHEALAALAREDGTIDSLLELNLRCGQVNVRCMELLDAGHTGTFGHPEPTKVPTGLKKGPAIVVSGHDLLDLENLLQQTEGKGVNVYTHGEMLPAHGYPGLKKYPHLAGHFGTAWQNQKKEFRGTPAAFLFTTNCIQEPHASYAAQVFTTGLVAWPGAQHCANGDFGPVIERALALGGPTEDAQGHELLTGCGHHAVLGLADKVVEAVKGGAIRHFFLVGGCDGAKPGRNYYTDLARQIPDDCVILTLACGKFRFNDLEFGDIGGIPRLLDVGQCNDAYGAVKIAQALAGAFDCGINDLPLTLILSWYEQKAVAILLSLLALGVKGIRLGPSLPAFVSPNVLNVLVERFQLTPITTPEQDLRAVLG